MRDQSELFLKKKMRHILCIGMIGGVFHCGCSDDGRNRNRPCEQSPNEAADIFVFKGTGTNSGNDSPTTGTSTVFSVQTVMGVYGDLTGREVLIAPDVPKLRIGYAPEDDMDVNSRIKLIEETMLKHDIKIELFGRKFVKVVRKEDVNVWLKKHRNAAEHEKGMKVNNAE